MQSFLGKEVNICQDVAFQFYLSVGKGQKDAEAAALAECSGEFDEISSDLYG